MKLSELVTEITDVVQDPTFTETIIKALINDAVLKIATGDMISGKYELTPPLPDLYQTDDVVTDTSGSVSLPVDFNRNVVMVVNSNNDEIPIENSFSKFRRKYVKEAAGSVFRCAVNGSTLYYRDIPSAAETLTVHYYRNPETLVTDGSTPSEIPAVLHRKLIVGYVCKELFNKIEDGLENSKINTKYYTQEYMRGLIDLGILIGDNKEPDYYTDLTDYS